MGDNVTHDSGAEKAKENSSNLETDATKASATTESGFNLRKLWPDIIKIPSNRWVFSCKEIVDRLGTDPKTAHLTKKKMEKCLMYFYMLKKNLRLYDHTYTAACILFFRYWYMYELPSSMPDCIHLAQAILATACKAMENNRPLDMYVKATCEFMMKDMLQQRGRQNMDKLKWDVRDKLVKFEKQLLCQFGFDLDLQNPKELIEEIFSGFYRYNRDDKMDEEFKRVFPKILLEARTFIIQAGTQPVSLLCDGFTFTALAIIYAGLQYLRNEDKNFKFPKNFFSERFPVRLTSSMIVDLFTDYRILEDNFFDLKSNKGDKLEVKVDEIEKLIDEDEQEDLPNIVDPYDYEIIKNGECKQEFLDHTESKLRELHDKIVNDSGKKRPVTEEGLTKNDTKRMKV
ncbi:HHR201Wp [Eremothecium sinecaudum]|uniref:HHR201Wp n=1 Tax=Eremothecium sinecaudum TaxID=45286 RepID=A0A0X8HX11_9SACH|nr:HHR201Wp [Eremothecium sinecaudum]AMD22970.1 HHR201Wp [Eremothecium sinecaudum]